MVECNSHETHNIYPNLNDQQQLRLNKVNEIKDYFVVEIYWELMSKRLVNTLLLLTILISHSLFYL